MTDPKDILNSHKGPIPEDKLMAYLEGTLPAAEQHEIEKWLAEEGMESDALEGLKNIPGNETKQIAHRLNSRLQQTIKTRNKHKKNTTTNYWPIVAVVTILLLSLVAYLLLHIVTKH